MQDYKLDNVIEKINTKDLFEDKNNKFFAFDESLPSPDRLTEGIQMFSAESMLWSLEMLEKPEERCGLNRIVS